METYEIKSTEKISEVHLKSFLLTNLEKEDFLLSSNSYIFASYLKELNKYQLIIFEKNNSLVPEIFLHKAIYENELLITQKFFCLYKEKKVYFYQELKEKLDKERIEEFIKSSFNLDNLSIVDKINEDKKEEKNYSFIKYKKSYLFKLLILYFLILFIALLWYFSLDNKTEKDISISSLKKKIESQKRDNTYTFVSSKIINLYYQAKQKEINLHLIQQNDNSFLIELSSLNKNSIYEFFDNYKTSINSFKYDELIGGYIVNANIEFIRK